MKNIYENQLNQQNKFKINMNNLKNPVQINSGIFGSVYLVQDKKSEEYFEAKVLSHGINDQRYKQSIIHEIGIIIRVQHPTLIKLHGFSLKDFEGNDNITILMDYPTNGSLAGAIKNKQNLISNNKYDNTARQIILVGVSYGMMHIHRYHIIHPNLSANNVLLDKDLKPLITNFCLTKFFEKTDTKERPINIESLVYKAPEVISTNKYNHKSDVYSFGILMYEIVTESVPYPLLQEENKMTIEQFKEKVVHKNYRPEFKVPIKKSIRHLIERCWSQNIKERPTFEELFNKLAFNIEDSIYDIFDVNEDDQDFAKYHLDNMNNDKLQEYINEINEEGNNSYQNKIEKLEKRLEIVEKENKKLKEKLERQKVDKKEINKDNLLNNQKTNVNDANISLGSFNSLSIKSQRTIIEKIIQNSENDALIQNLTNIRNLLFYFLQFDGLSESSNNNFQLLTTNESVKLNENPLNLKKIYILSNSTEILYIKKSLDFFTFRGILNNFDDVLIEIKYPSEFFKEIFDIVSNMRSLTKTKIKIGLFVFDIRSADEFYKIKSDFNTVRVNPSITILTENLFSDYSSMTQITIPNSVTSLEDSCFEKCRSLMYVKLPNSVKKIGKRCFFNCLSLREIAIPSSVESIGMMAFKDCINLREVDIRSTSIMTVEDSLFLRCSSLIEIKIPPSVKTIGKKAFGDCSSIVEFEIPTALTSIEKVAFEGCSKLKRIFFSSLSDSKLSFLGDGCFSSCSSLSEIEIPPSVFDIGWNAFSGCTSLREIEIPSSVEEIKYNAFNGCLNLEKVTIDPYRTKYSSQTFDDLNSLNYLSFTSSVTSIQYVYHIFENFRRISLPLSVIQIGKNSFSGCLKLREIEIPSSVTSIGDGAFFGCSALSEISIPSSVTSIGASCFSGCSSLKQVTIPVSVTLIGKNAFYGCSNLAQISILSSMSSIGESAFRGCSSLQQLTIYTSVDSIGSGAFNGCSSLTQIQIPYSVTSIKKSNKYQLLGIDKNVKIVTI